MQLCSMILSIAGICKTFIMLCMALCRNVHEFKTLVNIKFPFGLSLYCKTFTLGIHRAGIFDVFVEWTFGLNSYCRTFFQGSSGHQSKTDQNTSECIKTHQNASKHIMTCQNASLSWIQNLIGSWVFIDQVFLMCFFSSLLST